MASIDSLELENNDILVGTWNILCPTYPAGPKFEDKTFDKAWKGEREKKVCQDIWASKLDIIGLQEVTLEAYESLRGYLSGKYEIFWVQHDRKDDGVAILYNKGKFKENARTIVEKHNIPRKSLILDLFHIATRKNIRFCTVHLDGKPDDQDLGKKQLEHVLSEVEKNNNEVDVTICVGDFNVDQYGYKSTDQNGIQKFSRRLQELEDRGYKLDMDRSKPNSCVGTECDTRRKLDWIAVKKNEVDELSPIKITNSPGASDHFMVGARMIPKADSNKSYIPDSDKKEPVGKVVSNNPIPANSFRGRLLQALDAVIAQYPLKVEKCLIQALNDAEETRKSNGTRFLDEFFVNIGNHLETVFDDEEEIHQLIGKIAPVIYKASTSTNEKRITSNQHRSPPIPVDQRPPLESFRGKILEALRKEVIYKYKYGRPEKLEAGLIQELNLAENDKSEQSPFLNEFFINVKNNETLQQALGNEYQMDVFVGGIAPVIASIAIENSQGYRKPKAQPLPPPPPPAAHSAEAESSGSCAIL